MNGRHRAVVPGIHGLHHVERLAAAHLANDDAIRPHAQRISHQIPLVDLAMTFDIGRTRFELNHVGLLQLQLGRILDRDDAFGRIDHAGKRVEQRGLARSRAAGNEYVQATAGGDFERAGECRRYGAKLGKF